MSKDLKQNLGNRIEKIDELQKIEMGILDYLDEECKKNNLRYFLAYGTMLGAVRHHNFIPWDDDVDIFMPRKDYDRLVNILSGNHNGRYQLVTFNNKKDYHRPFIKIIDTKTYAIERTDYVVEYGLWIDIFPLDVVGNTKEEAIVMREKIVNSCGRVVSSGMPLSGLTTYKKCGRVVWNVLFSILGKQRSFDHYVDEVRNKDFLDNKFIASIFGDSKNKEIFESEWFQDSVLLNFGEKKYPVPKGYHEFLTHYYGDYMTLPSEEDRIHHAIEAYWRGEEIEA